MTRFRYSIAACESNIPNRAPPQQRGGPSRGATMSVKTITRVAAASALLGIAVLNPSVAQAKDPPTLSGGVTLSVCPASSHKNTQLDTARTGSVDTSDYVID